MLFQASVQQVRQQELPRRNAHIGVTMCYYPRGIKKEWRDEYRKELAPDSALLKDWKAFEKLYGHETAFKRSNYEKRFLLSEQALASLKMYSEQSQKKNVYFVCQCGLGERCHREMLLLLAEKLFHAKIGKVYNAYPDFEARIVD